MINFIWGLMIIIGSFYSIITGRVNELNNSINSSIKNGVTTIINMIGTICFWNGIINILINTELKNKIVKFLKPVIVRIFPKLKDKTEILEKIGINMTFNILGLGNAATPVGMEVVEEMEKNSMNDEIMIFILMNTASIQLIPTTILALRNTYNSTNSNIIIFPILINSLITFVFTIGLGKIYLKCRRKNE